MLAHIMSRRSFLAAAGLGTATLLAGCDDVALPPHDIAPPPDPPLPPPESPILSGPYQTTRVILGEFVGTEGMKQPRTLRDISAYDYYLTCQDDGGLVKIPLPTRVLASVYYPGGNPNVRDHRVPEPNPMHISKGPFPVLLYAHAFRDDGCETLVRSTRDFTSVDTMLQHVASYGCVVVAPDLSWLPGHGPQSLHVTLEEAFVLRAGVLVEYYRYLLSLNGKLFGKQLDLSRLVLVGHSQGGGAGVEAGRILSTVINLQPVAYGLIGPWYKHLNPVPGISSDLHNLLALHGTLDYVSDAAGAFAAAGSPKTLVTIPRADHFGYTSLLAEQGGRLLRKSQQMTGAAYLAALVRYYALGDASARPYLSGEKVVEGLEKYGVTGIEIRQDGFRKLLPPQGPTVGPPVGGR